MRFLPRKQIKMERKYKGGNLMRTKRNWEIYIYAAFFLAIAVLLQSLRLLMPMIPGPVNMFLIGSLVNMTLVMAVVYTGKVQLAALGLLLPCIAFFQGALPLVLMIPVVGIGNLLYAAIVFWLWKKPAVYMAAFLKAGALTAGTWLVLLAVQVPGKMGTALSFMMGWPQIITGILGILLAKYLLQRLPARR